MGRASRSKPANRTKQSPDIFFKRSRNTPKFVDKFWDWQMRRSNELAAKYPDLSAIKTKSGPKMGEWQIKGSELGVHEWKLFAVECARRIGYHGGPEGAVQFWMDHIHGDHLTMEKLPDVNMKEVDFFTQHSTGEREMHIGRYKQSGVDHYTDGNKRVVKEVAKPMPVPAPMLPGTEPLILIP